MFYQTLKNLVPFSVKRQIAKIFVGFLRLIFRAATALSFDIERRLPPNFIEFLRPPINAGFLPHERSDKPQIVVFFDAIPNPGKDSANVRMFALLNILSRLYRVVLVTIYRLPGDYALEKELNKLSIEAIWAVDFEKRFKRERCNVVILSYPLVADYMFSAVKRTLPAAKIIYDTVDVQFVRLEREFEITGDAKWAQEAARFREIEIRLANAADAVWCVTENDKEFLQKVVPSAKIGVVPNIHAPHGRGKAFVERKDLMFIGNYNHRPNVDAVIYFLEKIFPLVREELPDVKLYVVGGQPTAEIEAAADENVIVTGFAADVAPYFENCRVFVAPLRYGAGMKGKIGQALAFGLPVVTTTIGAEGMNLTDEREVLIADDPDGFATHILRVYDNERLWQSLSDNGYCFIAENYSPAAVDKKIRRELMEIMPDANFRL